MKPSAIKDEIIKMLEDIVSRTNYINYHHPDKDLSLDIDLIKDDMRVLYRYFDLLKTKAAHPARLPANDDPPGKKTENVDGEKGTDEMKAGDISAEESKTRETKQEEKEPDPIKPEDQKTAEKKHEEPIEEEIQLNDVGGGSESQEQQISDEEEPDEFDISKNEPVYEQKEKPMESADESSDRTPAIKPTDLLPGLEKEDKEKAKPETSEESTQKERNNSNSKKSVIDLLAAYSKKTIGDHYEEADNSLNKRISGDRQDNSIGTRMQLNPISSIKEVIGLNEKFLFINELFGGDIQEYHDAVARLNEMENMQSAFDYLNELSEKYSWDAERSTATINKLATYVQRRYM